MTTPGTSARIDLRSDTVTRPSRAMRDAMANAEVGDDVLDGDPTVRRLEQVIAERLGKDRALFFPTGTMANQTGVWLQAERGTEILVDAEAHLVHWEIAGLAGLVGVQPRPVRGSGLVFDADALEAHMRPASPHAPRATLVCVENTHNGAGGKVTDARGLRAIRAVAARHGLPVHMDGARLWNAHVALGEPLDALAACADTVMVSFSKGLGAPVGACLAGNAGVMERAWETRKRFGGGMRQSGILAAAALHGLEHNLGRLHEDHAKARAFAARLERVVGARVVPPDTNIVMIDLPPGVHAPDVAEAAKAKGVLVTPWSATRIRAVMHLDVDAAQVDGAADVVAAAIERTPA
jgi:threonine aldolase